LRDTENQLDETVAFGLYSLSERELSSIKEIARAKLLNKLELLAETLREKLEKNSEIIKEHGHPTNY